MKVLEIKITQLKDVPYRSATGYFFINILIQIVIYYASDFPNANAHLFA